MRLLLLVATISFCVLHGFILYGKTILKMMLKLMKERETLNVVFDQIGTPTYAGGFELMPLVGL